MEPKKRAILFIPSGEMLRLKPVSHWVSQFKVFTHRSPTEIALPAVGYSGPLYDSAVHSFPDRYDRNNLLPRWVKDAREALGENGVVWAIIVNECGFLDNEALWLRDQYDNQIQQICLTNPVAQSVLADLIVEIAETSGADGIAYDVTDAYPNSGAEGIEGIAGTCFCEHCLTGLGLKGFKDSRETFMGENGLLRLVLRLGETGAAHIDPSHEWISQRNSGALLAVSLARGFVKGEREALEADAAKLLRYFSARVELTTESIRSVLSICKDKTKRTAVVLGSADADLSQLVTIQSLDTAKSADEYWLPDAPSRTRASGSWRAAQFLANRATYYFNAFFETVEKANEHVIGRGANNFLDALLRKSKQLMANRLAQGAAYVVEKLDQYDGFVGIPLGQQDHLDIVERLTIEVTGQVLPDNVLKKFQIANPDKRQ